MAYPPPVAPRRASGVRVMLGPGDQTQFGVLALDRDPTTGRRAAESTHYSGDTCVGADRDPRSSNGGSSINAEREVEILNHCFDDIERFMTRLQQTAEAQSVLNQRKKKKRRSTKKKEKEKEDDLLTMKAVPPPEQEFVDIYQKFKYSFSLLDRLRTALSEPSAPELLHHAFVPLKLMVKTTGAELGGSVVSPALTSGALSLLQDQITADERDLWTSLGQNWTSARSQLGVSVPPYDPVFLDGWRPSVGLDPIETQHQEDAQRAQASGDPTETPGDPTETSGDTEEEENGLTNEKRLYCCSYDFVARNSSELSVLQGETLQVIESSKHWWKCRNRFDQIGFVPQNILEPLFEPKTEEFATVTRKETKTALVPRSKCYSYVPTNSSRESPPTAEKPPARPQSMMSRMSQADDGSRMSGVTDELLQRLAGRRGSTRPLLVSKATDAPLDYHSPAAEVTAWMITKGFSEQTVGSLGILSGAQLFSLNKQELCTVSPQEGARLYSQILVQKALLEDVRKASELETAMEKQKLRIEDARV